MRCLIVFIFYLMHAHSIPFDDGQHSNAIHCTTDDDCLREVEPPCFCVILTHTCGCSQYIGYQYTSIPPVAQAKISQNTTFSQDTKTRNEFNIVDPITSIESEPNEHLTPNEFTPNEPITSNEFTPNEQITPNESTPNEPITSNEFTPNEQITPNESTPNESITPNEFTPNELITPNEFTPNEPITPDEIIPNEPVASNVFDPNEPVSLNEFNLKDLMPNIPVTSEKPEKSNLHQINYTSNILFPDHPLYPHHIFV